MQHACLCSRLNHLASRITVEVVADETLLQIKFPSERDGRRASGPAQRQKTNYPAVAALTHPSVHRPQLVVFLLRARVSPSTVMLLPLYPKQI